MMPSAVRSAPGQAWRKRTRFPSQPIEAANGGLSVRAQDKSRVGTAVGQDLLLAFWNRSSCSLPRFTAASSASLAGLCQPHLFEFLVVDGPDLHEVAQAGCRATCRWSCGSSA